MWDTAAPVRGPRHAASARVRRPAAGPARAKDAVLGLLAVAGVLTVVWLIAAWALRLSIIVFVTGSMSPGLPTGSAAIVQEVDAADLRIGDVVTVTRENSGMPVTHRIIEIAPADAASSSRELTLRGDANQVADPVTYSVDEARRLIVGAPGFGVVVAGLKSPAVMVAVTCVLALAISWTLWPSRRRADP